MNANSRESQLALHEEKSKHRRLRFSEEDRKARLTELRQKSGAKLSTYATSLIDAQSVSGNIENFIGSISVPVGLAGPLRINYTNEQIIEVYAPIATTEGALISSVQRGVMAVNLSGGVRARVLKNCMIRAPQFEFETLDAALFFSDWVLNYKEKWQSLVKNRSQYAQLIDMTTHCIGRTIHVRFVYSTGNAAGQNMTTFCTAYLCQIILKDFKFQYPNFICLDSIIEGNLSSDKKISFISAYEGRGRTVVVETIIKKEVLRRVLKVNADELLLRFSRSKSAKIFTGQIGFNINVSNIVAGLFLATGQDAACIHESSIAELHLESKGDDLYASLYMPSLIVGTVGGGTHLPSFRDNLELLGCLSGEKSADRLAQTIASFALALELSTVSAVSGGQFVEAHEKGARKATVQTLKITDLNEDFFKQSLDDHNITKVQEINAENRQGYLTDIAMQVSKKRTGVFAYQIQSRRSSHSLITRNAFLKLKAHDREIALGAAKILQTINSGLAEIVLKRREFLPFKNSHIREIEILSNEKKIIPNLTPPFMGSFIDKSKETFILIQEMIGSEFNISEVSNINMWNEALILEVINKISQMHKLYLNNKNQVFDLSANVIDFSCHQSLEEQIELWDSLFVLSMSKLKMQYPQLHQFYDESLQNFKKLIFDLQKQPHTLIHYDFNPRNMAVNIKSNEIYFFDFEFAAWGPPQRDLVEFLLFISKPENVVENFKKWSAVHFNSLGFQGADYSLWEEGIRLAVKEFTVRRLPFYFILAEFSFCHFIDRILSNLNILSCEWERN